MAGVTADEWRAIGKLEYDSCLPDWELEKCGIERS
jgi:hypothetical protein